MRIERTRPSPELIEAEDPLVEDPLRPFEDGAAGVEVSKVAFALSIKVVPTGFIKYN
jgi:hypothetical protein